MFFQSDYILRMIQMMGDFFRRLLEIADEYEKTDELDRLMRRQCGLDANTAKSLSADSLIGLLPHTPRFTLSEMLYVQANAFKLDDEARAQCLYKALRLLLSVGDENLMCEMRKERLLELYRETEPLLTAEDMIRVFDFLLLADDFAGAEDVLFTALDTTLSEDHGKVFLAGIAAYGQLLTREDRELSAGGLPREEVLESLNELKRMRDIET